MINNEEILNNEEVLTDKDVFGITEEELEEVEVESNVSN